MAAQGAARRRERNRRVPDDVAPEHVLSAERYFGAEQGSAWADTLEGKPMARIAITPNSVGLLDLETRFPSAFGF